MSDEGKDGLAIDEPDVVDVVDEEPDGDDAAGAPRSVVAIRRTRRVLWTAVAVALPLTMLVAVLATRPSSKLRATRSVLVGKPAPSADGTTIDGEKVRLSDLRGKWVLVNFFATWCVPCREEHDDLIRFNDAHKADGDAQVFGVVYSDSLSAVRDFRAKEGGDWPMLADPDGRIALDFGVAGVPESFLIDPRGVIVSKILGGIRSPDLERLLAEAQAGRS